ncbi:MAG: exopolyphosphatase / guanosine-5-triphosphate,3-diphosphate pyrophosphatase [Bacillota bacterium]|jgi:exopolyphosphatase/guanosine-5'-triphosphate,3'-diphosphate pyrophosphatase|nr:exopolyphosphatase / guanosine-5-triphosphate,3-diphosphate pyrophosphatase [Bacillota bacterium]
MRLAAIDIGTNSTRLLLAETAGSGLKVIREELATTRLGEGIGSSNVLKRPAQARTAAAVARFLEAARAEGAVRVRLFATSATREAANRAEFLARVKALTGLCPEVLSGADEARLSYLGAARALGLTGLVLVLDVGGGSTELIWGEGEKLHAVESLKVGAVRLTEAYLRSDPPTPAQLAALEQQVHAALAPLAARWRGRTGQAVAVGGTATTLAAMTQALTVYDPRKVHGFYLTAAQVESLAVKLARLTVKERRKLPGLPPGRADIIVAGAAILALTVQDLTLPGLTVSAADLLLGSLYDELAHRPVTGGGEKA